MNSVVHYHSSDRRNAKTTGEHIPVETHKINPPAVVVSSEHSTSEAPVQWTQFPPDNSSGWGTIEISPAAGYAFYGGLYLTITGTDIDSTGTYSSSGLLGFIEKYSITCGSHVLCEEVDYADVITLAMSLMTPEQRAVVRAEAGSESTGVGVFKVPVFLPWNLGRNPQPIDLTKLKNPIRIRVKTRAHAELLADGSSGGSSTLSSQITSVMSIIHPSQTDDTPSSFNAAVLKGRIGDALGSGNTDYNLDFARGEVVAIAVSPRDDAETSHSWLAIQNGLDSITLKYNNETVFNGSPADLRLFNHLGGSLPSNTGVDTTSNFESCDMLISQALPNAGLFDAVRSGWINLNGVHMQLTLNGTSGDIPHLVCMLNGVYSYVNGTLTVSY